jgi:hypothetical protein
MGTGFGNGSKNGSYDATGGLFPELTLPELTLSELTLHGNILTFSRSSSTFAQP